MSIEIEDSPSFDNGVTYAIERLAELLGAEGWQMREGSEDYATDVSNTIQDVLKCAGMYDDETGDFAQTAAAQFARAAAAAPLSNLIESRKNSRNVPPLSPKFRELLRKSQGD